MRATLMSLVMVIVVATIAPAQADGRAITCKMTGSVEVKPGLRAPAPGYYGEKYKVKIDGQLTDCGGPQGAPSSADLKATGEGEGTCVLRNLEGVTSLKWDNGNHTTFEFSTEDVASANAFTTSVIKSNEPAMQGGDTGLGALKFTGDTSKCNTPDGVTSATFEGQLTSGSPS